MVYLAADVVVDVVVAAVIFTYIGSDHFIWSHTINLRLMLFLGRIYRFVCRLVFCSDESRDDANLYLCVLFSGAVLFGEKRSHSCRRLRRIILLFPLI